jgi:hypothetical protein
MQGYGIYTKCEDDLYHKVVKLLDIVGLAAGGGGV